MNTLQVQSAFIRDHIRAARLLWQRSGGIEKFYRFGRLSLCVRLIGESLEQVINPVLAHAMIPTGDGTGDAIIYAVDAAVTTFPEPPSDWPFAIGTEEGNLRTCWQPEHGLALSSDETRGIWHLMDLQAMEGLYWTKNAATLPGWEYGSPLRHFIHWTAQRFGCSMIHAAAISPAHNKHGVLLAGAGGSGKSTMTAAAIETGWLTTGDDFVVVQLKPAMITYPVFDIMKLVGYAETEFPDIAHHAINVGRLEGEKALVPISAVGSSQFVSSLDVSAALALTLTHRASSSIRPASKAELVAALAPSTMKILRTGLRETLSFCSDLARQLPCYAFHVGNDPREALVVLRGFIEEELPRHV